jgi:hypothetical protein
MIIERKAKQIRSPISPIFVHVWPISRNSPLEQAIELQRRMEKAAASIQQQFRQSFQQSATTSLEKTPLQRDQDAIETEQANENDKKEEDIEETDEEQEPVDRSSLYMLIFVALTGVGKLLFKWSGNFAKIFAKSEDTGSPGVEALDPSSNVAVDGNTATQAANTGAPTQAAPQAAPAPQVPQ